MNEVDVCLVTYHTEDHPRLQYLPLTITSCLQQTALGRLLILDNGSSPALGAFLDTYDDPRIERYRFEVNFQEPAWQFLAEKTTAPFLCFMCDDDFFTSPEALERLSGSLQLPSQGIAFPNASEAIQGPAILFGSLDFNRLFAMCFLPLSGTVFRRELISCVTEMNSFQGDWYMWLEMAYCRDIVPVVGTLMGYRRHPGSDTDSLGYGQNLFLSVMMELWEKWLKRGYVPSEKTWKLMQQNLLDTLNKSNVSFRQGVEYLDQFSQIKNLYGFQTRRS